MGKSGEVTRTREIPIPDRRPEPCEPAEPMPESAPKEPEPVGAAR